ncbi:hypothetical protein ACO22_05565 [Paracoccidioides brasiliensis]|uniref:Uncharacterized protein n=1 Tax=Paracoccidioides brasiliensis TaxID=121759 RepID=A0A1D2JA10_PARBR|nr:hypothetical protein ACO22_05565 [Paracoccidioides brasiliensis]
MGHGTRAAEIRGRNTPEEEKMGMISVARHGFLRREADNGGTEEVVLGGSKNFVDGMIYERQLANRGGRVMAIPVTIFFPSLWVRVLLDDILKDYTQFCSELRLRLLSSVTDRMCGTYCGNASPSNSIIASAPWAWKFRFAPKYTMGGSPPKSN